MKKNEVLKTVKDFESNDIKVSDKASEKLRKILEKYFEKLVAYIEEVDKYGYEIENARDSYKEIKDNEISLIEISTDNDVERGLIISMDYSDFYFPFEFFEDTDKYLENIKPIILKRLKKHVLDEISRVDELKKTVADYDLMIYRLENESKGND